MLLILVLALLFSPSPAEEELRGVKHKNMPIIPYYLMWHTIYNSSLLRDKNQINKKKKVKAFHFEKRPTPKFHSFWSAILIMIFLPPKVKERSLPFGPVVGEEGFEPPTPWFVATCSTPLSYRPHPVSAGSVPGSTLKKEPFLSHFGLRRCEIAFLSSL